MEVVLSVAVSFPSPIPKPTFCFVFPVICESFKSSMASCMAMQAWFTLYTKIEKIKYLITWVHKSNMLALSW